jgi:geranylgeranyl diphosphate synthase type I
VIPTLLNRYRRPIEDALRNALRGETRLDEILRYHIGLTNQEGTPTAFLGKLLRPALTLFTAEELGGRVEDAMPAAVGLELVHGFSLIHDDVQDRDATRRGRPAVWTLWGIPEAINAGDLMYTVAARSVLGAGVETARTLLDATAEMLEGQSMDLAFERRFVEPDEVLAMVDHKTGALFRCAFELGGRCAGAGMDVLERLRAIGRNVGRAFQIQDDLLGIWGNGEVTGKPIGSDVRRRKKSYPVTLAHARGSDEDRERLERIYEGEAMDETDVTWTLALLDRLGVRDEGRDAVRTYASAAFESVDAVPFSPKAMETLRELIEYLARREK